MFSITKSTKVIFVILLFAVAIAVTIHELGPDFSLIKREKTQEVYSHICTHTVLSGAIMLEQSSSPTYKYREICEACGTYRFKKSNTSVGDTLDYTFNYINCNNRQRVIISTIDRIEKVKG